MCAHEGTRTWLHVCRTCVYSLSRFFIHLVIIKMNNLSTRSIPPHDGFIDDWGITRICEHAKWRKNMSHISSCFFIIFFLSAIIYLWLNIGIPPRCPQVVWCHWGEIAPFSAMLAQDGLAECDQPGKIPWNTPPWRGIKPGPQGGQTVSYSTELSWLTFSSLSLC